MKKNYFKILLVCALSITLTNCDGEDGANGLDGTNGINGENGADGQNGVDGENGESFDDLAKYGSITVSLEGNRPDGEPFTKEQEFRFNAVEGEEIESFNSVQKNAASLDFSVVRFISVPDDVYMDNNAGFNLTVNDPGEATQNFVFSFELYEHAVISDDKKYFVITDTYDDTDIGVTNVVISDYVFNDETHNLTFSFSLDIAGDNNDTGNDLSISGTVDVIVLEEINIPI